MPPLPRQGLISMGENVVLFTLYSSGGHNDDVYAGYSSVHFLLCLCHRIDDDDVYDRSDLFLTGSRASERPSRARQCQDVRLRTRSDMPRQQPFRLQLQGGQLLRCHHDADGNSI